MTLTKLTAINSLVSLFALTPSKFFKLKTLHVLDYLKKFIK